MSQAIFLSTALYQIQGLPLEDWGTQGRATPPGDSLDTVLDVLHGYTKKRLQRSRRLRCRPLEPLADALFPSPRKVCYCLSWHSFHISTFLLPTERTQPMPQKPAKLSYFSVTLYMLTGRRAYRGSENSPAGFL